MRAVRYARGIMALFGLEYADHVYSTCDAMRANLAIERTGMHDL